MNYEVGSGKWGDREVGKWGSGEYFAVNSELKTRI
jgi:hypothetical protein